MYVCIVNGRSRRLQWVPGLHNLAVEEEAMAGWEIASARSALGAGSLGSLVPARRYPNGSGGGVSGQGRATSPTATRC